MSSVDTFPLDEGPTGVRGLAGNVRDWCGSPYPKRGLAAGIDRLVVDPAWQPAPGDFVAMRGGAWASTLRQLPVAGRFADPPDRRYSTLGFRLCRSLGGPGPP